MRKKKNSRGKNERDDKLPSQRVIKVSDTEYRLPCAVCGKIAVYFVISTLGSSKKEALICSGIVHSSSLNLSIAKKIFSWLKQGQISQVHFYLEKNSIVPFEEGIDAYCPECDKIFCGSHYTTREEWDEGWFYDCTYGTCPEGHQRIIHD
ncbi:MAG: hypothetical protein HWN66_02580 [Candidatus Helarchaeota archaeon]|nr:hypothetical protein [Candidatus Helarchaeota archaeon]